MKRSAVFLSAVALLFAPAGLLAKEVTVSISMLKFKPQMVQIEPGDTVIWSNDDDRGHTVVSDTGAFASSEISSGQSYKYNFAAAGEYSYHCDHHPRMTGKVVVKAK